MTVAKRLGLASVALVSLGASAAYYAVTMAMRGHRVQTRNLNYLILGLVAALTSLLLLLFWRSVNRTVGSISRQLNQMARSKRLGLVMVEGCDEIAQVTQALNRLLTSLRDEMGRLRAEGRELQIQSRLAGAEKKHAEAVIFSISDAVVVTNRFDELLLANDAAETLLDFKLSHSLRKNIDYIVHDGALVRLIRETRSSRSNSARRVVEHSIDQKGRARTFSVTLSCVRTPGGEVSGVVTVLHDITREKEISQMKTDFVSSVSHELRTPLASIQAYVEMLVDGEAEDEDTRREFYQIMAGEADRLNRLIENILNISAIESGVVRIVREPVCLAQAAKDVLEVVLPQARAKSIELISRLGSPRRQVVADKDMIYRAILNLVSNALKYTAEGGAVTVSTNVDERREVAVCEVSDTGVGIAPEDLPHIFDKFYRAEGHARIAKGTGLGLALVKQIIETAHDGKLSVTSDAGRGSTFAFELPILQ